MITKDSKFDKKCCLYASDYHLEMLILPYIKERLFRSKVIIITQNDLTYTIKKVLDSVNINESDKNKIINLNWNISTNKDIEDMKELIKSEDNIDIIINGDNEYIEEINRCLKSCDCNNIHTVDCLNINENNWNERFIQSNYNEVLNTRKI